MFLIICLIFHYFLLVFKSGLRPNGTQRPQSFFPIQHICFHFHLFLIFTNSNVQSLTTLTFFYYSDWDIS